PLVPPAPGPSPPPRRGEGARPGLRVRGGGLGDTGVVDDPLDQAVRRVAVAFRAVGAGWMLVLAVVLGLVGDIARPGLAAGLTAVALAGAAVVVRAGGAGAAPGRSWWVLVVDLAVAVAIVVGPAVAGDPASYYGGYPFASLVVGLAVGGRRGAVAAAMVLALATLTRV